MLKKVIVGGLEYKVEHSPFPEGTLLGQCDSNALVIRVAPEIPKERQAVILLHEILHAVFNHVGLDEDNEEQIVTAVANELYAVFKNNPKLKEMY